MAATVPGGTAAVTETNQQQRRQQDQEQQQQQQPQPQQEQPQQQPQGSGAGGRSNEFANNNGHLQVDAHSEPLAVHSPAAQAGSARRRMLEALAAGAHQNLLVTFNVDSQAQQAQAPAAGAPAGARAPAAATAARLSAFAGVKAAVFWDGTLGVAAATAGGGEQGLQGAAPPDAFIKADYEMLPVVLATVTSQAGLRALEADARVAGVFPDFLVEPSDVHSSPLINQPAVVAQNITGAGCAIAVVDTGLDYTQPIFGPCTAVGKPAGTCRVVYAQDITAAGDDGMLDDYTRHGTFVAAVAAEIAPGTSLIGLDVFYPNPKTGAPAANISDVIGAINWAIANKDTYKICAINLSLGTNKAVSKPCGQQPAAVAIQAARDVGIVTAVASGNEKFKRGLVLPACAPAAVSVGAVYVAKFGSSGCSKDAPVLPDKVTCYSNSASYLTMLAPGDSIFAAGSTVSGTSFAAPHVAAAVAALRQAAPGLAADDMVGALTKGGKPILDKANKITKPRLDMLRSLQIIQNGALLTINGGANGTNSRALSLGPVLLRSAPAGATYCASDTSASPDDCCATAAFTGGNLTATLASPGDGNKTVFFFLRGGEGCGAPLIAKAQASILLDATAVSLTVSITAGVTVTNGLLVITDPKSQIQIQITASDANGLGQMCITQSASAKALTKCKWEPFSSAPLTVALKGFQGNHTLRVAVRDSLGNEAAWQQILTRDTRAPAIKQFKGVQRGPTSFELSWAPGSDAVSGVAFFTLVYQAGSSSPAARCTGGTAVPLAPGPGVLSATVGGLADAGTYSFRLCAQDAAGNVANGAVWRGKLK